MNSTHFLPAYACPECGYTYSSGDYDVELQRQCQKCHTGLDVVTRPFTHWKEVVSDQPWVARYSSLLPVDVELIPYADDAALRPIPAPKLAECLGIAELNLIPQSLNPTGTFKDVEAAVIAAKAKEWQVRCASVHSTGNTALSYRHFFEMVGVPCAVFVPTRCAVKLSGIKSTADYAVYGFDGPFPKLSAIARRFADENGYLHLAPHHWKVEGKMAIAFAIAEFIPQTSTIVQTIAGGYGPIGYQLGLQRARRAGLKVPAVSYGLFQPEDANTIAQAIAGRINRIDPTTLRLPEHPFEVTLQSTNPLSTYPQVRKLLTGHSYIDSVSFKEVVAYAHEFTEACHELGIPIDFEREKSPYISWAGLRLRARQEKLRPTDRLAFVVTGSAPFLLDSDVEFGSVISDEH